MLGFPMANVTGKTKKSKRIKRGEKKGIEEKVLDNVNVNIRRQTKNRFVALRV
jgi:hypothetical protein